MNSDDDLEEPAATERLAQVLSRCPSVAKYDTPTEPGAWRMAYSFVHLEKSCRAIFNDRVRVLLTRDLNGEEINDLLLEIGEELRHVLYHIRDMEFYRYLEEKRET